jgi:hypothetical protein
MKAKRNDIGINSNSEFKTDKSLIQEMVKWVDDGIFYQGTVIDIFVKNGAKQLSVMTIFGKRRIVKMSKVKIVKTLNLCNKYEGIAK